MIFDYNKEEVFTKSIDVVDIGNTTLVATSEEKGLEYYLVIKTVMGKTAILKFGPLIPDTNVLLDDFLLTYQKVDFKESIINKNIKLFINDAKKEISDVREITDYDAFQMIPDFEDCFNNL